MRMSEGDSKFKKEKQKVKQRKLKQEKTEV